MDRSDKTRIKHIIEAAEEAIFFLGEKSIEDLIADRKSALALMKEIEIIGEAAGKISKEVQSSYNNIPWKVIVGMRNRLIHVYFDIDFEAVWKTVKYDLPSLLSQLKKIG